LDIPGTPISSRKTLKVIPLLTKEKNMEQAEYLVDKRHIHLHLPPVTVVVGFLPLWAL
jgi:hypothetical protein